ncbi:Translation initiation factor IF-2 [Cytospora mali]|uniref:Translation initiation factor IF-2 n=1 Tax=Cytospora mali TaxID=578113 RepID=A0A194VWL2_CYTMA|nr:Translation initiation factor IF-2 [Valsa mali]
MLHKRSHVHRRKPDDGGFLDFGDSLGDLADEIASPFTQPKRVVTVYETKTPEGWTGGVLTTLDRTTPTSDAAPIVTPTQSNDDDATPTTTRSTARETTAKETTAMETSAKETADTTLAIATSTSSTSDDDSVPTAIIASTASKSDTSGALAMATEAPTSSSSLLSTTAAGSTPTGSTDASAASATQSASTSSSSGSGDGATKAGIAIGVLAGIFIVLAIVYFVIRKRKRQLREERLADDEKLSGPFQSQPPATPAKAPRLSLRPMTQLFMGAPGSADRRMSKGPQQAIGMVASPTMKRAPGADAGERPMTSESQNVYNPFGNHAETIVEEPGTPRYPTSPMSPNSEVSTQMPSPTFAAGLSPAPRASAITTDSAVPAPTVIISSPHSTDATFSPLQANPLQANPVGQAISTPTASEAAALFAGATTGAAVGTLVPAGLQRKQSVRKDNAPAPLDLTLPPKMAVVPPSPTGTEFSVQEAESGQSPSPPSAGAAAIAAAGGPANSTVHRVQLDFRPTMDDELELHAGQIVRLLHEYDDGWALCIRLDRSQQGVVPRTCLSTRPVKPRPPQQGGPRGPPVNPQGRPQGRPQGPPMSGQRGPGPKFPPGNRPMGPPGGPPGGPLPPLGPNGRPRGPSVSSQRGPGPNYPPGNRPMGPPGRPGPPMGPGPRPQSPAMQRPQSPAGQRPQSPGPQGQPGRPQSPSGMSKQHSPPGPSQMKQEYRPSFDSPPQAPPQAPPQGSLTRKPVPGQAY